MKFYEFESIMTSNGYSSLAQIARALGTTPQAVSNWKARDQVPYHIAVKLNNTSPDSTESRAQQPVHHIANQINDFNLSDLLLTLSAQLKVIVFTVFISVFLTFTYVQFIQVSIYSSSSTILYSQSGNSNPAGLAGLASQFGVSVPQNSSADLSNPSLFPQLIKSRTFAERILSNKILVSPNKPKQTLFKVFTDNEESNFSKNTELIQQAVSTFHGMVRLENQGSLNVLYVESVNPTLAKELNYLVLEELKKLNRLFKIQHVNEKVRFIEQRIVAVKNDLETSEKNLKSFRERNRQTSSPALQLELERITREVEIQKNVFLTLKQQYELSKIEEVQEGSVFQILDEPKLPLYPINRNIKLSLIVSFIFGAGLGLVLALTRSYLNNSDMSERRKLRQVRQYINKKSKEVFLDRRITGSMAILLLIFSPIYFGQQSSNPTFFGMYSSKMMTINFLYLAILIFLFSIFIYETKKNRIDK